MRFRTSRRMGTTERHHAHVATRRNGLEAVSETDNQYVSAARRHHHPLRRPAGGDTHPGKHSENARRKAVGGTDEPRSPLRDGYQRYLGARPRTYQYGFARQTQFAHHPYPSARLQVQRMGREIRLEEGQCHQSAALLSGSLQCGAGEPPGLRARRRKHRERWQGYALHHIAVPAGASPQPAFNTREHRQPAQEFLPCKKCGMARPR